MLLIPRQDSQNGNGKPATGNTDPAATAGPGASAAPSWVFPFDKPPAPEEDGNQALAVNTKDGTVVYDVAFALVWAEEGPVDTANEAYAFASCTGCAAVAVGFQVVLIIGQANVIVPENLSAAVNYNCVECLTYALASQLVLTLDGPLSDEGMAKLSAVWAEIEDFSRTLQNIPLSEIQDRLTAYKQQIMDLIAQDPSATTGTTPATPATGTTPATPATGTTPATPPTGENTAPAAPAPDGTEPGGTSPAPQGTVPATGEPAPATTAPAAPTAPPGTSTTAPSTPAATTPTPTAPASATAAP
jgi:putative peptide zinc metalloprotease protein